MTSMPRQGAAGLRPAGLRPPTPSGGGLALVVLSGALGLDVSGLGVLNAALPGIGTYFHLDSSTLQWVVTSYAAAFAGFLLFGGRAADVLGRRLVFSVGIAVFTVAALTGALAPNVGVLIVARGIQGVGAALSGPAALSLLTEIFPEGSTRNRAMSVYASVGAASFSGGVVLGGVLTNAFGWRSVLAFSVFFGAVVLLAIRVALPPSVRHDHRLDLPGAGLVTAGLLSLVLGVSRGGSADWGSPATIGPLVASVVLLVAFVLREHRAAEPLLPLSIFRSNPVRMSSYTALAYYTAAVGLLFFAPLYMQEILGFSPLVSGLAVVPSSVFLFVTANLLTGRLLGRTGPRLLMAVGLALIAVSMILWSLTPVSGSYWAYLLPGFLLTGVGQGLTFPAMTIASLTGSPQGQHGVAGAVNVTAQQIGSSVGVSALVVISVAWSTASSATGKLAGFHAAYLAAAAFCLVVAVVVVIGRRGWENASSKESLPES